MTERTLQSYESELNKDLTRLFSEFYQNTGRHVQLIEVSEPSDAGGSFSVTYLRITLHENVD